MPTSSNEKAAVDGLLYLAPVGSQRLSKSLNCVLEHEKCLLGAPWTEVSLYPS